MESAGQNTVWHLLRANSDEAKRTRRRLAAGSGLAAVLAGLLVAARLEMLVLAAALLVLGLVGGKAVVIALRRKWRPLKTFGREVGAAVWSGCRVVAKAMQSVPGHVRRAKGRLAPPTRRVVRASLAHADDARTSVAGTVGPTLTRAGTRVVQQVRETRETLYARRIDLQREALRLNAAGTKQRRNGAHAEAIELHKRALELLRGTEDPRAVALTQNNLALALSHVGDDRRATTLFEQAAATVRELGDDEHEGRIMANLALAHRRHGRPDQCDDVLRHALTKLGRDSAAYKRVEAELGRVS
jgi:tetratricopeptide (TPR) repeat protein